MIPFLLALLWPPFAALSLRYRSERAAALAGGLAAAGCLATGIVWDYLPAIAVSAVWLTAAAAALLVARPAHPSRRERLERRRRAQAREAAWGIVLDEALDELDSTDLLVPVIKNTPRRVP